MTMERSKALVLMRNLSPAGGVERLIRHILDVRCPGYEVDAVGPCGPDMRAPQGFGG